MTYLLTFSVSFLPLQYGIMCVNEYPMSTTTEHNGFWSFSLPYLYCDKNEAEIKIQNTMNTTIIV